MSTASRGEDLPGLFKRMRAVAGNKVALRSKAGRNATPTGRNVGAEAFRVACAGEEGGLRHLCSPDELMARGR